MELDRYTGTIGHIGVFSLNVHKHMQSGEGGVCVTRKSWLANAMKRARNHGELSDTNPTIGLNLRMTELTAAVASAQLAKGYKIARDRAVIAMALTSAVRGLDWMTPPTVRGGCEHVYYIWPILIDGRFRNDAILKLKERGVPVSKGYVTPLYKMPVLGLYDSKAVCPVTESVQEQIMIYENCSYSPTPEQVEQIGQAFRDTSKYLRKESV